jgi:riboflavin kinase/FMN adenylyltransferase
MASHVVEWRTPPPEVCRGGAATIGNFDGVHRGHAALVAETAAQARRLGVRAVAVTFDPPPVALLRPAALAPPLTTLDDRCRLLQEAGADEVAILHTTADLLALTAADFVEQVVRRGLAARALVEGYNFGFGRNREGDVRTLDELARGAGLPLTVLPPQTADGEVVSSSRVRAVLLAGDVAAAARLLGRPYRLHGVVAVGQRRGRTLGFPTANLEPLLTLAPGDGVYAATAAVDGTTWPAAVNVGPNPTFGEGVRKVEAHLIGYQGDLYGRPLAVDFLQRLRGTRPFGSAAELATQLCQDVERARAVVQGGGA